MRVRTIGIALAVAGIIGTGTAQAARVPNEYVLHHLRVGGATDFKGRVFAQQGLRVRHGLNIDTLTDVGSAQIGGSLAVAGTLTSNGLNGGAGAISTTGALQAGSLTLSGAAAVTGSLSVGGTAALQGATVGVGGLQVAGPFNASGGSFTAAITAPSATFSHLAIASGGTVDFGGATLTNVNLSSTATSLSLQSGSAGGTNGFQPLTITQAGKAAALSVAPSGFLTVNAAGLDTSALSVSGNEAAGSITTNTIASGTRIALNAPLVTTQGNVSIGGNAHLLGTHDMRGTCTANASVSNLNTCQVGFASSFTSPPVVVVTPTNVDPAIITGFSVQSSTGGFTIAFRVSTTGTYTFNYIVEG